MLALEQFFVEVPFGKTQGFCEPPEGRPDDSVVVNIHQDCTAESCLVVECHMFRANMDAKGKIINRQFVTHTPEYYI